jgi:hypothetical protein
LDCRGIKIPSNAIRKRFQCVRYKIKNSVVTKVDIRHFNYDFNARWLVKVKDSKDLMALEPKIHQVKECKAGKVNRDGVLVP